MTISELAARLGVDEADIRVLVDALDEDASGDLDPELADDLERMLSPNGERTAAMS